MGHDAGPGLVRGKRKNGAVGATSLESTDLLKVLAFKPEPGAGDLVQSAAGENRSAIDMAHDPAACLDDGGEVDRLQVGLIHRGEAVPWPRRDGTNWDKK